MAATSCLASSSLARSAARSLGSTVACLRAYSSTPPSGPFAPGYPPRARLTSSGLGWMLVSASRPPLVVEGKTYQPDAFTNVTPQILSKLPLALHLDPSHPIGIIRSLIESHFSTFTPVRPPSAVVSVRQNFDELGFPPEHPARVKGDSYYLDRETVLRTHTSAHELEAFRSGLEQYLISGDVYRRDEVDRSHYPVFHQMEGASVWSPADISKLPALNDALREKIARSASPLLVTDPTEPLAVENPAQPEHDAETLRLITDNLKLSLNSLILTLFRTHTDQAGEPLQVRWINATFPWTAPSYEVEVFWGGEWLEILGCGVVKQDLLKRSGASFYDPELRAEL
jgi:phenylalanyl-tRNA synthetase alpha chain